MKRRLLVVLFAVFLVGCATQRPLKTAQDVKDAVTYEYDQYNKTTFIYSPTLMVGAPYEGVKYYLFYAISDKFKNTHLDSNYYSIKVSRYGREWKFLDSGYDINGNRMDVKVTDRKVDHFVYEYLNIQVSKQYLLDNRQSGIDIKLNGGRGETRIRLSPHLIDGFLQAIVKFEAPSKENQEKQTSQSQKSKKSAATIAKVSEAGKKYEDDKSSEVQKAAVENKAKDLKNDSKDAVAPVNSDTNSPSTVECAAWLFMYASADSNVAFRRENNNWGELGFFDKRSLNKKISSHPVAPLTGALVKKKSATREDVKATITEKVAPELEKLRLKAASVHPDKSRAELTIYLLPQIKEKAEAICRQAGEQDIEIVTISNTHKK